MECGKGFPTERGLGSHESKTQLDPADLKRSRTERGKGDLWQTGKENLNPKEEPFWEGFSEEERGRLSTSAAELELPSASVELLRVPTNENARNPAEQIPMVEANGVHGVRGVMRDGSWDAGGWIWPRAPVNESSERKERYGPRPMQSKSPGKVRMGVTWNAEQYKTGVVARAGMILPRAPQSSPRSNVENYCYYRGFSGKHRKETVARARRRPCRHPHLSFVGN